MQYLCIIPARSGSKGIPSKNIIDVCGKPMISYTIELASKLKKNGYVEKVIVSTDCSKIAEISKSYGAEVPFLRPKEIAGDKSKSIDFVLHSINYYEGIDLNFDAIMVLQPTSPLRSLDDVKETIKIFKQSSSNSLISTYKDETINDTIMYHKIGGKAIPLNKKHNSGYRRQDSENIYIRNGAIYITKVNYIKKNKRIVSREPEMYVMAKERSINIDTFEDLYTVRNLLCK